MRISDWSSDVCSFRSIRARARPHVVLGAFKEIGPRNAVNVDFGLIGRNREVGIEGQRATRRRPGERAIALDQIGQLALSYGGGHKIGRASWRERVCQYGQISGVAGDVKKEKREK